MFLELCQLRLLGFLLIRLGTDGFLTRFLQLCGSRRRLGVGLFFCFRDLRRQMLIFAFQTTQTRIRLLGLVRIRARRRKFPPQFGNFVRPRVHRTRSDDGGLRLL